MRNDQSKPIDNESPDGTCRGFREQLKSLKPWDDNIQKTLDLVEAMLAIADQGDMEREDPGCGVIYGILRDFAYKIKKLAKQEKASHIKKGQWKKAWNMKAVDMHEPEEIDNSAETRKLS
jgi:hypothetical protein